MTGRDLFEALIENTGLPEESTRRRFESLVAQSGNNPENLNIDQVRELLSSLLLDLIEESFVETN